MKNIRSVSLIAVLLIFLLPGCDAIGSIFKAGVWAGIIIVVVVVAIIIFFATRGQNK